MPKTTKNTVTNQSDCQHPVQNTTIERHREIYFLSHKQKGTLTLVGIYASVLDQIGAQAPILDKCNTI